MRPHLEENGTRRPGITQLAAHLLCSSFPPVASYLADRRTDPLAHPELSLIAELDYTLPTIHSSRSRVKIAEDTEARGQEERVHPVCHVGTEMEHGAAPVICVTDLRVFSQGEDRERVRRTLVRCHRLFFK